MENLSYSKFNTMSLLLRLGWRNGWQMLGLKSHVCYSFFFKLQTINLKYFTIWLNEKYRKYKLKKFKKDGNTVNLLYIAFRTFQMYVINDKAGTSQKS